MPPLESTARSLPLLIKRRRALRGLLNPRVLLLVLYEFISYFYIEGFDCFSLLRTRFYIAPESSSRDVRVAPARGARRVSTMSVKRTLYARTDRSARERAVLEDESAGRGCVRAIKNKINHLSRNISAISFRPTSMFSLFSRCGDRRPPLAFTSTTSTKENLLRLIYCPSRPVATR